MRFVHCPTCSETLPLPDAVEADERVRVEAFHEAHRECGVRVYVPTGRATASLPWHEPLATRRLEVCSDEHVAIAVGTRRVLDEPVRWRLEPGPYDEQASVELDRDLFRAAAERALRPLHVPRRALEEWGNAIERFARAAGPSDVVLLEDDPRAGNATFARLSGTARARLEAAFAGFGFDVATAERLRPLFEEELFPPLRVVRRLVSTRDPAGASPTHP